MSSPKPNHKQQQQRHQQKPTSTSWQPNRQLTGLPILVFLALAQVTMAPSISAIPPGPGHALVSPLILDSKLHVPLQLWYSGWKPLDGFLAMYAAVFTGSIGGYDELSRMQMVGFLADLVGVQIVMGVERARRANASTVASFLPLLIISLMYQVKGIGFLGPIYFYLYYVQCPPSRYTSLGSRTTNLSITKAIIPTVLLTYIIPGIAMFTVPDIKNRQWINGMIWQPFPIYAAIVQTLLVIIFDATSKTSSSRSVQTSQTLSNVMQDVKDKEEQDIDILRYTYIFAASVSSLAYLYIHLASPASLVDVFFSNLREPSAVVTFLEGSAKALRYDYLCCFGAMFTWVLLSFVDLKAAGLVDLGWVKIVGSMLTMMVTIGPGAMLAIMWYLREMALVRSVKGRRVGAGKRK